MDISIQPVTPEGMRARGADAFDRGLSIDDHGMNPGSAAIADWREGWRYRQAEDQAERAKFCTDQLLILAMGLLPP